MSLPYLAAVTNETLCIHLPTPFNLPTVVLPEGRMTDGHWIPGGVRTRFFLHKPSSYIYRMRTVADLLPEYNRC